MRTAVVILVVMAFPFIQAPAFADDYLSQASQKIEEGRIKSATRYLSRGAGNGDERCDFVLGLWALTGVDGRRDAKEASRRFIKAANSGLLIAQANLGLLYASGDGVRKNEETAAEWYRKAAESGDPLGQAALGAAIFLGAGVEQNNLSAFVWTSLAAAQGNERARGFLSPMKAKLSKQEIADANTQIAAFRTKDVPEASKWQPTTRFINPTSVANIQ